MSELNEKVNIRVFESGGTIIKVHNDLKQNMTYKVEISDGKIMATLVYSHLKLLKKLFDDGIIKP